MVEKQQRFENLVHRVFKQTLIGVVSHLLCAASYLQLFSIQYGEGVNGLLQDFLMLYPHGLQWGI